MTAEQNVPGAGRRVPFLPILIILLLAGWVLGRVLAPRLRIGRLVAALASPEERGAAYRSLYDEVGPDAIPALIALAQDEGAPLHARSEAVELLGRIGGRHGDARPLEPLLALTHPDL